MTTITHRVLRTALLPVFLLAALVLTPAISQASLDRPARGTTIKATDTVHLRAGPSTSDDIVATVPIAATATVLNTTPTDGFYRVGYQGRVGWTHGDYWTAVPGLMVNGFRLLANEETAVRWIAANTMPRLQGTLSERLTLASRVTWWSLKEGVLGQDNPHRYANCDNTIEDPLATCAPGCCWQVGIAAAQVENFPVLGDVEAVALRLYPGSTATEVLAHTANYSGYPTGTAAHQQIVNSSGTFRISWLLRNHGVGFTLNAPLVTDECVTGTREWCYGTEWDETARYAPTRTAAIRSIGELRSILYALAPS